MYRRHCKRDDDEGKRERDGMCVCVVASSLSPVKPSSIDKKKCEKRKKEDFALRGNRRERGERAGEVFSHFSISGETRLTIQTQRKKSM